MRGTLLKGCDDRPSTEITKRGGGLSFGYRAVIKARRVPAGKDKLAENRQKEQRKHGPERTNW
jgi:hypothetical protein